MTSIYEKNRKNGVHQVEDQRIAILDAAETLFLAKGLENTTMGEIAKEAGIHRTTLYRYFADRDPIAFEVAIRMLKEIKYSTDVSEQSEYLLAVKEDILAMIDQFDQLRNAYRYLGMFDYLYGDSYPNNVLAESFKEQINAMRWGKGRFQQEIPGEVRTHVVMLLNTVMSFLEKLAARGELMAREQDVSLEEELKLYKRMICVYIDDLVQLSRKRDGEVDDDH